MTFYEMIKGNQIVFHPQGQSSGPKSGVAHLPTLNFWPFSYTILHFISLPLEILQEKFNAFN